MSKGNLMSRQTVSDRVFDIVNYSMLVLLLVLFIYPLIFIFSASISDPNMVFSGKVWLFPKKITLEGYKIIFDYKEIWIGYKNSLLYVLVGVPFSVVLTLSIAYPLSRKDFMLRNVIMGILTFTMFFGGGMIPTYLLMKNLGLLNNFWALITPPSAVGVYNIIITRTYFQTNIPNELREAADIDGCSNMKFFRSVVLPLSTPIIAVITLFYAVGKWNMFFEALIYISNRSLYPLQLILREIIVSNQLTPEMLEGLTPSQQALITQITNSIKYGVIIVASVPVLIAYPFVQKYFVKGIMVGAIKG